MPFLEEHKQFGLPRIDEIRAILDEAKLPWHGIENSPLDRWLGISWLSHFILGMSGDLEQGAFWLSRFNHFYNSNNYLEIPARPCYRMMWSVVKDPSLFSGLPACFQNDRLKVSPPAALSTIENPLYGFVEIAGVTITRFWDY